MENPLVSVIMPVRNGEKYIIQAVESVYIQDVQLELIVVDDASKDKTSEVLQIFKDLKNFRYLHNKEQLGVAESRNIGVSLAVGRYIAFLDSDDIWAPGKLRIQLDCLNETGYVMCSTGRELIKADGSSTGKYIGVKRCITYRELLKHNSINCSSVLILKETALEFPMCCEESHEDFISWLMILQKYGCCAGINKPYLKYRLSPKGKSRNKWSSAKKTYLVYRYMGYGIVKRRLLFLSYAIHGVVKYL